MCLSTEQLNILKPQLSSSQQINGTVAVTNFTPAPLVNILHANDQTVGNWYKCETVDTETLRSVWVSMGAVASSSSFERPPVGRVFRCLLVTGASASVFSPIIYSENVKVSNFPALQPVSVSNPEVDPAVNTIPIRECKIGFWYKIEQLGTTPEQAWIDLGTEPIVGRIFRVNLDNQYILELTGTGEVSILPYFTAAYTSTGSTYFESNGVVTVESFPMVNTPFVSNTVGTTAEIVAAGTTRLRSVLLQKTDNIITYVYIYNQYEAPTDADTPVFRFIVKDTPIQIQLNQLFYQDIWIRATSDLNGTTDPIANTLFVNITWG